jgi:hypothetical protein
VTEDISGYVTKGMGRIPELHNLIGAGDNFKDFIKLSIYVIF